MSALTNRNIFLISIGGANSTPGRLFNELKNFISQKHSCRIHNLPVPSHGLYSKVLAFASANFRFTRNVIWSDTVIFNGLTSCLPLPLLVAKILGRRIVFFEWDIYPSSISGVPSNNSLMKSLVHQTGQSLRRLATTVVVPSEDFIPYIEHDNLVTLRLWPLNPPIIRTYEKKSSINRDINICFTGQLNKLRGIESFVKKIESITENSVNISIHIFSSDKISEEVRLLETERVQFFEYGMLTISELLEAIRYMHFGIVSLHPNMDQPAYPSKTFDYVMAGIPIIYHGPRLAGYIKLLTETGIGANITDLDELDIFHLHETLSAQMEIAQKTYFCETSLSWEKIAPIL